MMWKNIPSLSFTVLYLMGSVCLVSQVNAQGHAGLENADIVYAENFNSDKERELPPDWWVEGGQEVYVRNGHLLVKADPRKRKGPGYVATVWLRKQFSGDIRVQFDAHVVSSTLHANNINFFLYFSSPQKGSTMYSTRNLRLDGLYPRYHDLNGYIFTYLKASDGNSSKARFRMRRCPGFGLIDQNFAYQNYKGKTYHITVTKMGDKLTFAVDGKVYMEKRDRKYNWKEGIIGFRTFHTVLWFDNIKVEKLLGSSQ